MNQKVKLNLHNQQQPVQHFNTLFQQETLSKLMAQVPQKTHLEAFHKKVISQGRIFKKLLPLLNQRILHNL